LFCSFGEGDDTIHQAVKYYQGYFCKQPALFAETQATAQTNNLKSLYNPMKSIFINRYKFINFYQTAPCFWSKYIHLEQINYIC
jgi:hypothetical protein